MQTAPFTVRRRVNWGETDPAGIVYTPRFLDFAVEAAEAWYIAVVGIDWYRLRNEMGMGAPIAHVSMDFYKPLAPAETFTLTVLVESVGRSAITLGISGHNEGGERCFEATLVSVIVGLDRFKARRIPDDFRQRIEAYQAACEIACA